MASCVGDDSQRQVHAPSPLVVAACGPQPKFTVAAANDSLLPPLYRPALPDILQRKEVNLGPAVRLARCCLSRFLVA